MEYSQPDHFYEIQWDATAESIIEKQKQELRDRNLMPYKWDDSKCEYVEAAPEKLARATLMHKPLKDEMKTRQVSSGPNTTFTILYVWLGFAFSAVEKRALELWTHAQESAPWWGAAEYTSLDLVQPWLINNADKVKR